MATFSAYSKEQLRTCDDRLQRVFNEVIKHFDCKIIEGYRGEALQRLYFKQGKTKVDWPNGKHNQAPSKAVDAMPCPLNWFDKERMCLFAGFVLATAMSMEIKLRWGKDWDMDTDLNEHTFQDGPHYEVID